MGEYSLNKCVTTRLLHCKTNNIPHVKMTHTHHFLARAVELKHPHSLSDKLDGEWFIIIIILIIIIVVM